MMKNIELCGYQLPTPIQAYCLPSILTGHDIIAVAQTGKDPQLPQRLHHLLIERPSFQAPVKLRLSWYRSCLS